MDKKQKKIKRKLIVLYTILCVSIIGMLGFGTALFLEFRSNQQGSEFYADMPVAIVQRPVLPANIVQTTPRPTPLPGQYSNAEEYLEVPDAIVLPVQPFVVDFDQLRTQFPNIVGWIQSAGTPINYPIVQSTDNDFYLYRLPNGVRHPWGSIFLDYRNAPDFSSSVSIIYGHNMRSDDMFGSLRNYRNQSFFDAHDSMFIFTPEQDYLLLLFAGYLVDSAYEVPPMNFQSEETFNQWLAETRNRSFFHSQVDVSFDDRIMFLATCTDSGRHTERFVIVGRLVPVVTDES